VPEFEIEGNLYPELEEAPVQYRLVRLFWGNTAVPYFVGSLAEEDGAEAEELHLAPADRIVKLGA